MSAQPSMQNFINGHQPPLLRIISLLLLLLLILTIHRTFHKPFQEPIQYQDCAMAEVSNITDNLIIQMRDRLSIGSSNQKVRLATVIFADKAPNKPSTVDMIKNAWTWFGGIKITARDLWNLVDHLFAITADDENVAKLILENSPWTIKGFSLHFQVWPPTLAIEELPSHQIAFWVQMMGVPPYMSTKSNVRDVVARFGDFIEMEDPLEGEEGTFPFFRVHMLIDARKPIPTGFKLPRDNGAVSWVEFQYEKLAKFCFVCGRLGHVDSTRFPCPNGPEPGYEEEYGAFMAIDTLRRPVIPQTTPQPEARPIHRRSAGQVICPPGFETIGGRPTSQCTTINPCQLTVERCSMEPHNPDKVFTASTIPGSFTGNHTLSQSIPFPSLSSQPFLNNTMNPMLSFPDHVNFRPAYPHLTQTPPNHFPQLFTASPNHLTSPPFNNQMSVSATLPQHMAMQFNAYSPMFEYFSKLAAQRYQNQPIYPNHPSSSHGPNPLKRAFPHVNSLGPAKTHSPKKYKHVTKPKQSKLKKLGDLATNEFSSSEEASDASMVGGMFLQGGGGWPGATRSP
ncbi:hypothetical protein ACLB2K_026372 [Fragaria x ananassa]